MEKPAGSPWPEPLLLPEEDGGGALSAGGRAVWAGEDTTDGAWEAAGVSVEEGEEGAGTVGISE